MIAELTIKFHSIPDDIKETIKNSFSTGISLKKVISNSIYSQNQTYHDCFFHGFQTTEIVILFQISANDLIVHLETPNVSNVYITLTNKINSYYKKIIQKLVNHKIETKKLKPEVIILSEGASLFTGTIPNKNEEFIKQLDKDKFRLIIFPVTLFVINYVAYKFKFVDNINSLFISAISQTLAIFVWYVFDHYSFKANDKFNFQNINE